MSWDLINKMDNSIFNEDCLKTTMRDIEFDYVITSPPDYEELGLTPIKDDETYIDFLRTRFGNIKPSNRVITIVVSNRQYKRKTIMKNRIITDIMLDLGFSLLNEKIWIRTKKVDLYRYGYSYVMSFGRKGFKSKRASTFLEDVWEDKIDEKYSKYPYQFSVGLVKRCIENFTDENDVVFDCFSGIMTTAVGCIETNRRYLMSEIDLETCAEGKTRVSIAEINKIKELKNINPPK
jgi:DNA modification methylase